jgi:hypothetical protein
MADKNDKGFKVTDRRKFNADGSLKDAIELAPEQATAAPAQQEAQATPEKPDQAASGNVVSFPGEPSKIKDQPEPSDQAASAQKQAAAQAAHAYQQASSARPADAHQASFLSMVNMLASETAMFLGLIESPVDGSVKVDLESARELIDLLGVLEEKTRGNLTSEEEKVIEDILAYLRMQYVMASKKR